MLSALGVFRRTEEGKVVSVYEETSSDQESLFKKYVSMIPKPGTSLVLKNSEGGLLVKGSIKNAKFRFAIGI